jgi:hypothetical protein
VFDAVRKGYLDEMQFSIFQDPNQPNRILELYSFNFQYSVKETDTASDPYVSVQMNGPGNTNVLLLNAREALNTVIRNMVGLAGTLPALPASRCVLMHIIYNERRPAGYQPEGFHPSTDGDVSFPTDGWEMQTTDCGQMQTGHQAVGLRVSYTSPVSGQDIPDDEVVVIPDQLKYGEVISRFDLAKHIRLPFSQLKDNRVPGPDVQNIHDTQTRSTSEGEVAMPTATLLGDSGGSVSFGPVAQSDHHDDSVTRHKDEKDQQYLREAVSYCLY